MTRASKLLTFAPQTSTMKRWIIMLLLAFTLGACNKLGTKIDFNGDEVYYKDPVTDSLATAVGTFLKEYHYFTGNGFAVQVLKNEHYQVHFATIDGIENDQEVIIGFYFLMLDMSNLVLNGNPIDIALCDDHMAVKRTLTYTEAKKYLEEALSESLQ